MCKILVIPHVKPNKSKELWNFVTTASGFLTKTERHGFGYMALDDSGNLFGERWVSVTDAFRTRDALTESEQKMLESYKGFLNKPSHYNAFGDGNTDAVTSICLHARTATNAVNLQNTHPFIDKDSGTALIHNGVVQTNNLELKTSSCDSEGILNAYIKENLGADINNIQSLADKLNGWYACAAYGKVNGEWYLDVFKDNRSSLDALFIKELNILVFCTTAEVVISTCKKLKWTITSHYAIRPDNIIRINPFDGQVIEVKSFNSEKIVAVSNTALDTLISRYDSSSENNLIACEDYWNTACSDPDELNAAVLYDIKNWKK